MFHVIWTADRSGSIKGSRRPAQVNANRQFLDSPHDPDATEALIHAEATGMGLNIEPAARPRHRGGFVEAVFQSCDSIR